MKQTGKSHRWSMKAAFPPERPKVPRSRAPEASLPGPSRVILLLLALGFSRRAVAYALDLSGTSVKEQMERISRQGRNLGIQPPADIS